jgi:L-alanine-DL-glutamate epimerase-like enolase superfamily enzyme
VTDTEITDAAVRPLDLPLSEPFEIALGTQEAATNVLVRVELADGTVGIGEGSPLPPVTGETQDVALAAAREGAGLIEGRDAADHRPLVGDLRAVLPGNGAALLAAETAVLDAYCRSRGLALSELFGAAPRPVETDLTIPIVDPGPAADRAAAATDRGFRTLKVKCGDAVADSVERVRAVADAAPDASVVVDANQGWSPPETRQFADVVVDAGVSLGLLEQPVPADDLAGLAAVREAVPVPVVADEAVFDPEDAHDVCRAYAADVVNVKLAKAGLLGARDVAAVARAAGREVMVGCMLESAVGIRASAHVVAGLGGVAHADLDGNRLLAEDVIDGADGPTVEPTGPGHGVDPAEVWPA